MKNKEYYEVNGQYKQTILDFMVPVIRMCRNCEDLVNLEFTCSERYEETVICIFKNGYTKEINVNMDSALAMISDVCRHIQ